MSILDKFNNPDPGKAQLNRFTRGQVPSAGDTYRAYEVNDQHSLTNSKLHNEFSNAGTPVVNLANNKYNASPKIPTNLTTISDSNSGFSQEYSSTNKYTDGITTTIR
jgi:hypothetical protein